MKHTKALAYLQKLALHLQEESTRYEEYSEQWHKYQLQRQSVLNTYQVVKETKLDIEPIF